jgi:PAS domain S-box-containing protein
MIDEYSTALQQAKKDLAISPQTGPKVEKQGEAGMEKMFRGIWAYDVKNNRIYLSTPLLDMLGMPRQEAPLPIESVMALIHPEDRPDFETVIQTCLSTGEPFAAELRMGYAEEKILNVQLTGKVYLDTEQKPIRISGWMIHLTELQKAENSLQKVHKELADIRHALDESTILSITDRYGIITYINDALCRISQYSHDELIGETLQILNSGHHSQSFFREIWNIIGNGQIWRGEIKHQAKDRTYFWMDTTIVPLLDINGKPFQYVVVRHEITRQKAAEQEIQDLKEKTQVVAKRTTELEDINMAQSQEINKQGREIDARKEVEAELIKSLKREKLTKHLIQLMNRSFDTDIILEIVVQELGIFFGVDRCMAISYERELEVIKRQRLSAQYCRSESIESVREEEIPWDITKLLSQQSDKETPLVILNAAEPEKFPINDERYLEKQKVKSFVAIEIKYRRVSFGRLVLHQCSYPRIWTDQEISFLEVLSTHIGAALYQAKLYQQEKQAKQEAEEANKQKSKVLSFVSHDFKNPLDSLKRFIGILENDKSDILSEKHRELTGYIAEGVYQLRNMVTDILDKARLAEGKITPAPEWIETKSFIDDLKPMFNSMASQKDIEININIQQELTAIKADQTHLRQILINLVSNAVKYNRTNGKVFLKVYKSKDKQFAVIEVQDTGYGIPERKIPQLFTEYFRGDLSQSSLVEGTGLGLTFIKKLIELHGGTITVESVEGGGSTFTVYLPLR